MVRERELEDDHGCKRIIFSHSSAFTIGLIRQLILFHLGKWPKPPPPPFLILFISSLLPRLSWLRGLQLARPAKPGLKSLPVRGEMLPSAARLSALVVRGNASLSQPPRLPHFCYINEETSVMSGKTEGGMGLGDGSAEPHL